jgi:hypothetical protein
VKRLSASEEALYPINLEKRIPFITRNKEVYSFYSSSKIYLVTYKHKKKITGKYGHNVNIL